jgi:flagellar biosynthesis protein FliR
VGEGDPAGVFAAAFAGSAAFAAFVPLAGARAVPAVARLALALAMAPLVATQLGAQSQTGDLLAEVLGIAALGGATGLGASVVAGASAAAGSLIDNALGTPATGSDRIFGQEAGPFGMLAPLAFAFVMTNSGALTWLVAGFCAATGALAEHFAPPVVMALGRTLFAATAVVALPALSAHAFAALVAGTIARLTPRVNGMLLAPAIGSLLVLFVVIAGAAALLTFMTELSRITVRAALL